MVRLLSNNKNTQQITFKTMSIPAKALASCIILVMSFGMLGATGQIVVHDIIPTFFVGNSSSDMTTSAAGQNEMTTSYSQSDTASERGDLFSELSATSVAPESKRLDENEQFVWVLRWTHIHLFGIGMIFIFVGVISLLLDAGATFRTWLIVLPFIGMLIDIAAMWLKGFVSPVFFWLHLPGGGLFGLIFGYVSLRALWEMWIKPADSAHSADAPVTGSGIEY